MLHARWRPQLLLLLLLASLAARPVSAAELPSLPLQDCAANGLVPNLSTDCEGTLASYSASPAAVPRPGPNGIALAISTRDVDFRLDEDLPGSSQTITFTYTTPGLLSGPGPDGGTYYSIARLAWPETMVEFNSARVNCRQANSALWGGGCDGEATGGGENPDHTLLVRQGECGPTTTACTYRVTWGPYDRRVRQPMLFRINLTWFFTYTLQKSDGTYDGCGPDPVSNCAIGSGTSHVVFRTTPPAPLNAIGTARRVGAKAVELDSTDSFPLVDHVQWTFQYPVVGEPMNRIEHSSESVFTFDFGEIEGIPASYFQGTSIATLAVTDHWNRTEFDFVPLPFAEPAGTEGPLQITSFTLVDIDEDGKATLLAVVKNTTDDPIENVYVIADEAAGLISPNSTPGSVTLAGDASTTFTVTLQLDDRPEITARVKAFGTTESGPVKSTRKSQRFGKDGTVAGDTTVSQASKPGDTTLHVASNDGFDVGDYVVINIAGENVEARPVEALGSLIFAAPLKHAHAVGEPVATFANDQDTDGPTITVTSPVAGAVICQGATLTTSFTCSDTAGVETCGSPVTNGQALDTSVPGPRTTTLRAWDIVGNVTETTVSWSVGVPTGAGGCTVPTTTSTLPGGTTTSTLVGATTTTTLPPMCGSARECLQELQGQALCEPPVTAKLQRFVDRKVRAALAKLGKAAAATKETKAAKLSTQAGKLLAGIVKKANAFAAKKKGGISGECRAAIAAALAPAQQRIGEGRL